MTIFLLMIITACFVISGTEEINDETTYTEEYDYKEAEYEYEDSQPGESSEADDSYQEEEIFLDDWVECMPPPPPPNVGETEELSRQRSRKTQNSRTKKTRRAPANSKNPSQSTKTERQTKTAALVQPTPSCKDFNKKLSMELQKIQTSGKGNPRGCKKERNHSECMLKYLKMARNQLGEGPDPSCLSQMERFYFNP